MPQILVLALVLAFMASSVTSEDISQGCLDGEEDFCTSKDACQSFYNRTCFEHTKGKPKICKDLRKCIEETFLNFDSNQRHGHRQFGNMSVCSKLDVLTAYCNTEGCKKTYDQQCFDQVQIYIPKHTWHYSFSSTNCPAWAYDIDLELDL